MFYSEKSLFSLKFKSDIVFSVYLSLDKNFMKLEKRSYIYLTNSEVSDNSQNMFIIYVIDLSSKNKM